MTVDDAFSIVEKVLDSPLAKKQKITKYNDDYTPNKITGVSLRRTRRPNGGKNVVWTVYINFGYTESPRTKKRTGLTLKFEFNDDDERREILIDALYIVQDANFIVREELDMGI